MPTMPVRPLNEGGAMHQNRTENEALRIPPRAASAILVVLLFASSACLCFGQQLGAKLLGTVTDPASAVVPDARVTALNPASGRVTTATTQSDGSYVFPYLEPADYTITVEKAGFDKYEHTRVTLVVNQNS